MTKMQFDLDICAAAIKKTERVCYESVDILLTIKFMVPPARIFIKSVRVILLP